MTSNNGPWMLQTIPLIGLGIAGALFLWGFQGFLLEWRRVQRIVRVVFGIDARIEILKVAGRVVLWMILAGLGGCVFLLPARFPFWPVWASLAIVFTVLIAWRMIETKSMVASLPEGAFFTGMFLASCLQAFPAKFHWIVFATASVLILAAVLMQPRDEDPGRTLISWSALGAYNQGDYALAIRRALQKDEIQQERASVLVSSRYRRCEFDEAESLVRASLALQVDGRRAAPHAVLLAKIQIERGQFEEATLSLDAAYQLDPDNVAGPRIRTLLALRQGQVPPPIPMPDGPETPLEAAIRAWTLAENGFTQEARDVIGYAVVEPQSLPDLAETCYYAGRALMKCGDCAVAEQFFHVAMRAEGNCLYGLLSSKTVGAGNAAPKREAQGSSRRSLIHLNLD
jgi:hypothetical protein